MSDLRSSQRWFCWNVVLVLRWVVPDVSGDYSASTFRVNKPKKNNSSLSNSKIFHTVQITIVSTFIFQPTSVGFV
jgi:hypothetical protein